MNSNPGEQSTVQHDQAGIDLDSRALLAFFVISFAICWGIIALYVFLPDLMASVFGQLTGNHPLFFTATYAPAIAALLLIVKSAGLPGLRRFLSRLLIWRCSAGWWLFMIVGLPAVFYLGFALKGEALDEPFPFPSVGVYLVAVLLMAIKGPVEEIGWRGLALPIMQRRLAPFWAGLILGIIWGIWHFPAFLLSGTPQSNWSFTPFFLGAVAISIIVTVLFNKSRGSILLPAFFHFQLINPLWPDAQPFDTVLLIVIAGFLTVRHRRSMFASGDAVTTVIPPGQG
ncbi:MAG: hypothetical protein PsegKO_28150 [Pseudohongiellaceae bacterium]